MGCDEMTREADGSSPMIERSPRKYERVRVGGSVRLMADTSTGLCMATGYLVDISEGGCAIFTKTRVEEHAPGRVQVEVGSTQIWLPIVTRWTRRDSRGWTIGCAFDRPTDEKQRAIRALVWERRSLIKS
jgi:hypothetical protein